jgi:hypothetical protein
VDEQERYSIAALAGAVLYAFKFFVGTWQGRALLIVSGWSFANWIGPALIESLPLKTEEQKLGFAFLCGYFGDKGLSILGDMAETLIRRHLTALLKKD